MQSNLDLVDSDDDVEEGADSRHLIQSARIMLVDNGPANTDVLKAYLVGEGYANVVVADSTKAIAIMKAEMPDVVLLELILPHVSGFDVLQAMRTNPELKRIPVMILTAADEPEAKLKSLQLGAMDFLTKPVDAGELSLRIRNTLAARAYHQQTVNYDRTTGLPQRDMFIKEASQLLESLQLQAQFGAVMHIQLNNLRTIRHSVGRDNCEKAVSHFARVLDRSLRSSIKLQDVLGSAISMKVGRLSDDVFCVLLGPLSNVDQAASKARRIEYDTSLPVKIQKQRIIISAQIGISIFPDDARDVETLISNAETATSFVDLHNTSDKFAFYLGVMNDTARRSLIIENGLRSAIDKNELRVIFQPKIDTKDGTVVGAEALVRWMSPELGVVLPNEFIPIAERTGLIIPIGTWVLEHACAQAAHWRRRFSVPLTMSVNVSIRQFQETTMDTTVSDILEMTGLPAHLLTLEMTENMIMDKAESNVQTLHRLRSSGVRLAVDDFGTGYSSLAYLQRFPLDELKIDRTFIAQIDSPDADSPIVKAMVSMAHDLGMIVVAEGIETDVQLDYVKSIQCECYQGFLSGRPVVADVFTSHLEEQFA